MKSNSFNDNVNVIGINLKRYREQQNISQERLCDKLALLGITLYKNDIYRIENNKRLVRDFELWGIAKTLNVKMEQLLTLNDKY